MNIGKKAIALFVGIAVVAGLSACSGSRGGASKNVSQGIEKGAPSVSLCQQSQRNVGIKTVIT